MNEENDLKQSSYLMKKYSIINVIFILLLLLTLLPSIVTAADGTIENKDIRISVSGNGYKISLCNNLKASELEVYFDGNYKGTISRGVTWGSFNTQYKVSEIVVSAAKGSYDSGRSWSKKLNNNDWPIISTTITTQTQRTTLRPGFYTKDNMVFYSPTKKSVFPSELTLFAIIFSVSFFYFTALSKP